MKNLGDYVAYFTEAQLRAHDSFWGYLLEYAVKDYAHAPMVISEPGKTDVRMVIDGKLRHVETKQNGGDFRHACKGNSYIAYAVYIDVNKPLREQFGYVMPMKLFKEIGGGPLHHIRSVKKDRSGLEKMSLQTLYVYKSDSFLGAKGYKLADAWEAAGAIPFKEFFAEG